MIIIPIFIFKDRQDYLRIGDPYPEGVLKILVAC
jgi:hypothetical protein